MATPLPPRIRSTSTRVWRWGPLAGGVAVALTVSLTAGQTPLVLDTFEPTAAGVTSLVFVAGATTAAPGVVLSPVPVVEVRDGSTPTTTSSPVVLSLTRIGDASGSLTCTGTTATTGVVPAGNGRARWGGCAVDRGGRYRLVATLGSLTASRSLVVSGPAVLGFTPPPSAGVAGVPLSGQPVLQVQDAAGAAVPGAAQKVGIVLAPGTGTPGAVLTCTDGNVRTTDAGRAAFTGCAVDRAGTYALLALAELDGVIGRSPAFTVAGGPASALRFLTAPVGGATGGIAVQPRVAVVDAGGGTVSTSTTAVTLAVTGLSGATGTLTCAATTLPAVAGEAGYAGCSVSAPGTYTLNASASGLPPVTSAAFTVVAGGPPAARFTTQPGTGQGGGALSPQPVVKLSDAGGSPASGLVSLSLQGGPAGAALRCDRNPVVSTGDTASFTGCRVDAVGTGYTLVATAGGAAATSAAFSVSRGQVRTLRITTAPARGLGGADLGDVVVRATDAGGNPAEATVVLSLVPTVGTRGAVLACPSSSVNSSGGTAVFADCAVDLAGEGYRLQATVSGAPSASDTTPGFDVGVGPATALAFSTSPGGGTGGLPWSQQPVVAVLDAGGNRIVDSPAQVQLSTPDGGPVACTSNPLPVVRGAAVFAGCALDAAGTGRTLVASAAGLRPATSAPFAVAAGPASQLLFTSQPGRGAPGAALLQQPQVTVADAGGNPAAGATGAVQLALTPGTGVAGAALGCSSANVRGGVAGFGGCRVDLAGGGYTLTATHGTLRAESRPFDVVPPAPAGLTSVPTAVPAAQTFGGRLWANNPTTVADSVNTSSGALQTSVDDLEVVGVGHDLLLTRTYTSADTAPGAFGPGWSSVLDLAVLVEPGGRRAVVRGEDGQRVAFARAGPNGPWTAPPGARASLKCTGQEKTCTVERHDGTTFEVAGTQLVSYLDANGEGLRFGYDGGQLRRVLVATKDRKRPLVVTVTTDAGRVTGLRTPTGRSLTYAYTAALLTSVTDLSGATWRYEHEGARLSRITDPDGNARLLVDYAADGRVSRAVVAGSARHSDSTFAYTGGTTTRSVSTATGRAVHHDHYAGGALVRQELPEGGVLRYGYDRAANLTHVQEPAGWVQVMTYDAAGNMLSQTSANGTAAASVVRMTYDTKNRMTSQTDPRGSVVTYSYAGPNLSAIRPPGPEDGATRLKHDKHGLLRSVTTPLGMQSYTTDDHGNTVKTLDLGRGDDDERSPLNGAGTTSTYDEAGRQTALRSPLGIASTWERDAAGRVLRSTTPTGTVTHTYSAAGVALSSTAFGETSTFRWDEASLTRTTRSPAGTTTQRYDGAGNVVRETSPTGLVTEHGYDGLGREVRTTTGSSTVSYTYDDASNVVAVEDSDGADLRQQFDALNRTVRQVGDDGETRTSYDAAGNVTGTRDSSGATTARAYDAHGNPSKVTDGQGTTSYQYDLADNVVRRTDGRGGVTTWSYDAMSRPTSMSVAGARTSYGYDLDGRLVRTTDPEGRTTTLELDPAGNPLLTKHRGQGYASVDVKQTFDGRGRRTSLDGVPVTYDDRGNVASAAGFGYDRTTPGTVLETYPGGGKTVRYEVDEGGNLMSVSAGTEGTPGYVGASYVRDGDRRATGLALSNGVLQSRSHDAAGNLLDQTVRHGGQVLAHDAYTWDGRGNRLSQRSTALGSTTESGYAYEPSGRLAGERSRVLTGAAAEVLPSGLPDLPGATAGPAGAAVAVVPPAVLPAPAAGAAIDPPSADLRYDAVGNRTSAGGRSWTHGPADEIVTDSSGARWSYDRSGAVTGRTGGGQPTVRYTYDAAARLIAVSSGTTQISYGYDGDGNRTSRTSGGRTTTYAWSPFGSLPQLALAKTGSATTYYVHGEGPVAQQTGDDVLFFHPDPMGSTNAVTDAAGALVASYRYSAFGEVVEQGPRAGDVELLFQAQQLDRTSGLYNMRARQYDPQTGRFTAREPAPTPVGVPVVSAYAFVGNAPTTTADPTGRTPSATTVFAGQYSDNANAANNANLANKAAALSIKVVSKVGGYSAALASASANGGVQLSKAASVGQKLKFAGVGLAVIGIGLQAYVTAENCAHGPVEKCVASATGLALNVGFTVGCSFITAGAGSAACAICGAILGITLEYVISEYGPQIVAGLIEAWEVSAPWVGAAALVTAEALVDFGNDVADVTNQAVGTLVLTYDDAVAAVTSGYADALALLADAGLTAVQLAGVLTGAFDLGARETIAALTSFGYSVAQAAQVLEQVFDQSAQQAAAALIAGFDIATTELAAALDGAYALTDAALTSVLAGAGLAVAEVAAALDELTTQTAAGIAALLDGADYAAVAVAAALSDALDQTAAQIAVALVALDHTAQVVAGALRDVADQAGAAAAATLKSAGLAAEAVAGALVGVYDETAAAATAALAAAGYQVQQVAAGLKSAYSASAAAATSLLRDAAFTSIQVAGALSTVYGQAAAGAASLLRSAGYGVVQVADALETTYLQAAAGAARLLADAGFAFTEIGVALKQSFDQTAALAASVLQSVGAASLEVAVVLKATYAVAAAEMARLLADVEDAAVALQQVYGLAAAAAAQALDAASYTAAQVGAVLVDVFHTTAADTARLLEDIGAAASEVVAVLGTEFGIVGTDILNGLLQGAGYASDAINAIGGAFEDFGRDVEDFFSSLF